MQQVQVGEERRLNSVPEEGPLLLNHPEAKYGVKVKSPR
jgi:hypothetical protein